MARTLLTLLAVLAVAWAAGSTGSRAEPAPRPLPFHYDLYTFRGDTGSTTVVASFAVPAGELEEEREDWSVRYGFDVTLVLSDTARGTVTRRDDSVMVRLPRSLEGDHLLHTYVEVQARPSANTVQRVIVTDATAPGIGQLYTTPFPIPDYGGDDLMLSDIALGLPGATSGWRRGDATLALLPTSQFPESAFDVFYEIYNLPAGHAYSTVVSVQRLDPERPVPVDEGAAVHLGFSARSPAGPDHTVRELRRVESSLPKGRYRLTVTVTDEVTRESARRSRLFRVRGWGPGTTLVPALPRTWPPIRASSGNR